MRMWRAFLGVVVAMALVVIADFGQQAALAQERSARVEFGRGQSSTVIRGTVRGYDGANYRINVRGGQRLAVTMDSSNSSNYFNILGPAAVKPCSTAQSLAILPTSSFPVAATMSCRST